ncbi:MAG: hypothetical protein L0H73_16690 [Nitrococcus sp.]|nr:hypothetical protein [Nitrococcus sp.]
MLRLFILLGLFGGTLIAGTAQATMVDYTGEWASRYNGHEGATTGKMFGSNYVSLSTNGNRSLRFTAYDGGTTCGGLSCRGDGVGIGDDEIGGRERLTVTFSNAVTLNSVQFFDLFAGGNHGDAYTEQALMKVNFKGGTKSFQVYGAEQGYLKYDDLDLTKLTGVKSISFFAAGKNNSDFALASLDFEWTENITSKDQQQSGQMLSIAALADPLQTTARSVPEPGPLWLMLIGSFMIGLTGTRARRLPGTLPGLPLRP